ncbi:hypothetical protein [Periweissella fabalis]|uniref:Uncharacterized protein n=1 Tax=Periweissella fabalis TaxID=1070421 RepID=A0A7X6N4A0_9LACO|nr:hypothetical protein [Periweissella fabalis]MCM0598463.1 hypothetical protein [Periweissella fabalis]NKZ25012.1 hypothetical protein [Periweissella fabalis]
MKQLKIAKHEDSLIYVKSNLDLLPSYSDLQSYEKYLYDTYETDYEQDRIHEVYSLLVNELLERIEIFEKVE